MEYIVTTLDNLIHQTAFFNLTVGNYVMILVACVFLYLAIAKGFEPLLLVPIAFGMLLVNIYPDIMMCGRCSQWSWRSSYIISTNWMNGQSCRP